MSNLPHDETARRHNWESDGGIADFRDWLFPNTSMAHEGQGWQTLPVKGQRANLLGFVSHTVSVATLDNMSVNCVPITMYLQKQTRFGLQVIVADPCSSPVVLNLSML